MSERAPTSITDLVRGRLFGRVKVLWEPRDLWVGAYVSPTAVYVCPLPMLVARWARTYHKAAALITRDQRMLVISSGMDPHKYSLPGGRMVRGMPPIGRITKALHDQLARAVHGAVFSGDYRVISNIDRAPVHVIVHRVTIDGQDPAAEAGRRFRWVDGTKQTLGARRLTTSAQAVLADAIKAGMVRGGDSG